MKYLSSKCLTSFICLENFSARPPLPSKFRKRCLSAFLNALFLAVDSPTGASKTPLLLACCKGSYVCAGGSYYNLLYILYGYLSVKRITLAFYVSKSTSLFFTAFEYFQILFRLEKRYKNK